MTVGFANAVCRSGRPGSPGGAIARRHPLRHDSEADDLAAFRSEVDAFLTVALTPDLREAGRNTAGTYSEISASRLWHQRLFRKGWIAPAWPAEYGGTGWSPARRFLFEQECARNDAPVLFAGGIRSIGPLLIAMGTPEQKARYLPAILSGDDLWCQGFSEANAGSDLAALTARATAVGDDYIVTGRKLWTTGAHVANRMFALVRTRQGEKPQDGITFLLIDMNSPGLTVRPIISMDGNHEFNEVILESVRVPAANRVSAENEGWSVAKHLMRFARSNNTNASLLRRTFRRLQGAMAASGVKAEPHYCRRVAEAEIALAAFESLELKLLNSGRLAGDDEAASSLMKVSATELHQRLTELLCEMAAPFGGPQRDGMETLPFGLANAGRSMEKYLATRAASIYSGSSEVHRNLIAKSLLR